MSETEGAFDSTVEDVDRVPTEPKRKSYLKLYPLSAQKHHDDAAYCLLARPVGCRRGYVERPAGSSTKQQFPDSRMLNRVELGEALLAVLRFARVLHYFDHPNNHLYTDSSVPSELPAVP